MYSPPAQITLHPVADRLGSSASVLPDLGCIHFVASEGPGKPERGAQCREFIYRADGGVAGAPAWEPQIHFRPTIRAAQHVQLPAIK